MQKSMWALSGKSWARSAAVWSMFAIVIGGLAEAGAGDVPANSSRLHQVGAAKLSGVLRQTVSAGTQQVAKVETLSFDLSSLSSGSFGDADDADRSR